MIISSVAQAYIHIHIEYLALLFLAILHVWKGTKTSGLRDGVTCLIPDRVTIKEASVPFMILAGQRSEGCFPNSWRVHQQRLLILKIWNNMRLLVVSFIVKSVFFTFTLKIYALCEFLTLCYNSFPFDSRE